MFFFIPTGSNAERTRRPLVTMIIAGLCVVVFVGTTFVAPEEADAFADVQLVEWLREHPWLEPSYDGPRPEPAQVRADTEAFRLRFGEALDRSGGLARRLSLVPSRGFAQVGWVTGLFVHFGFFHLLGNLLFLWIVGPLLEEAWGRRRFAVFYLAAGLVASLAQFALSRHEVSSIGGASGAIAGSMGAFAVRFASSRIRFLYFLWFIRPFAGSVWVPAWLCGLGWFGSELWDLGSGGVPGVATGAHVGGFVLGGVVAFAMRGLGFEKELLTVAESREEQARIDQLFFEAQAAHTRGDFEAARQLLVVLQQQAPHLPGLTVLLAEVELRAGRGQARLERVLRDALKQPGRELEGLVTRLEDFLDPRAFSPAFAWQLAERLARSPTVAPGLVRPLVEAAAAGSGAAAREARAWLAARAPEVDDARPDAPAGIELELPKDEVRVLEAAVVGVSAQGLEVAAAGATRVVPFETIGAVHAGLVPSGASRALLVDLVLRQPGRVVRLRGTDPRVPALFPGQAPAMAWQAFLAGLRRAARLPAPPSAWTEHESLEAFVAARPR